LDALEAAHKNDLRIVMTCVLSRWNLDAFEHVLQIAKQFDATVQFQPATQSLLGVDDENPATPAPDDFQKTVSRIIELKNSQYKNQVGNSLVGLNHLRRWPAPVPVRCISGLVSGRIEPDGALYHCGRVIAGTKNPPNVLDKGFRAAFEKLAPFDCSDCWCAQRVELMLATEFKIDAIRNMFNIY
jgi:MoaA/NifB/PqqE/SkfB family radical SAM enzyme